VLEMMAFYLHLGTFATFLIQDLDRQISALDAEAAAAPVAVQPIAAYA